MKIEDVKKRKADRKFITIRISKELSDWLYENQLSPTAIFVNSCKELGFKLK